MRRPFRIWELHEITYLPVRRVQWITYVPLVSPEMHKVARVAGDQSEVVRAGDHCDLPIYEWGW